MRVALPMTHGQGEGKMATNKTTKKPATAMAAAVGEEKVESAEKLANGGGFTTPFSGFAGYEELADLGRENFAAVLRANAALSEGLEAIGKEMMGYARTSFESAAETAAALLGAKTLEDVVQLNSDFARTYVERLIERSQKLSDMSVKVANETLAPLGSRVEATVQKLGKQLAA
jgi:phasin family protein